VYSTNVYHYTPRQIVVVNFGNSTRRYQNVYAKTLKLHKGVDNKLQFQVLNQDQKPVNITNKEITLRIISFEGSHILLKKSLMLTLPLKGLAELQVTTPELEHIDAQKCYYTLEIPDGGFDNLPIFIDNDGSGRGVIDIVNSTLPSFKAAYEFDIPSHPPIVAPLIGQLPIPITYYTSIHSTSDNPIITIQIKYTDYTGDIIPQGSTTGVGEWYDIDYYDYDLSTGTEGWTITGYHPYIRLKFVSTHGTVDKILAR